MRIPWAAFKHVYDLANRPIRIESIDAGIRRTVLDAAGNSIEGHDSKGALVLHAYDTLNRPTRLWARDGINQPLTLRERLVYGDDPNAGLTPAQIAAGNSLGKLYQHYDEAGLLTFVSYDFKGNLLEKERQVIADTSILAVFNPSPSNWEIQAFRVDWETPSATSLDATAYTTTLAYDALNRVKTMLYPKDVDGTRKVLRPHYNRAGALERVELTGTMYVEYIAYNAKGQRTLIAYGNGVMTRYAYNEQTFRLVRMRTESYEVPAGSTYVYHPKDPSKPLQDSAYEYDLVGNILKITDRTPGCGVVNTSSGKDALNKIFTYDPLYRLISATGRECLTIPKPRPWEDWRDTQNCGYYDGKPGTPNQDNAPNLTTMYWETYVYDPAGNMVTLQHGKDVGPDWTRHFGMGGLTPQQWEQEWPTHLNATGTWSNPPSNCLTHVGDNQPGVLRNHFYDENGNLVKENTERHFEWDHSDRMCVFRTQAGSAEPSKHAHYFYDATGQRVKKLLCKQGGQVEVTIYIDGVFEFHRLVKPSETMENNTLHVMDNQSRIALVRVGDAFPDDGAPNVKVKYLLGDHLGSSNIMIDDGGAWINREEFFPYGQTSFGSFARKRYRFTGKERDDESGLYYHGARYYAPWLMKWVSCDPAGLAEGINGYIYGGINPLRFVDPDGGQIVTPDPPKIDLKTFIDIQVHSSTGITNRDTPSLYAATPLTEAERRDTVIRPFSLSEGALYEGQLATPKMMHEAAAHQAQMQALTDIASNPFSEAGYFSTSDPIEGARRARAFALAFEMAAATGTALEIGEQNAAAKLQPGPKVYSTGFQMRLNQEDWGTSRDVHLNRANAALDKVMQEDPQFANMMEKMIPGVKQSVSSVAGRETPSGWTWEHASSSTAGGEMGVMRLVPAEQHTPGSAFWRLLHPDPGAAGGYSEWAIPAGAKPNK